MRAIAERENRMYCTSCGFRLYEGDSFCVNCGAAVTENTPATPAEDATCSVAASDQDSSGGTTNKKRGIKWIVAAGVCMLLLIAVLLFLPAVQEDPWEKVVRDYLEAEYIDDFDTEFNCLGIDGKRAIIRSYNGLENGKKDFARRLHESSEKFGYGIDYDYFEDRLSGVESVEELYEFNREYLIAIQKDRNSGYSFRIVGIESEKLSGRERQKAKNAAELYYLNSENMGNDHVYDLQDISAYYKVRVDIEHVYPDHTEYNYRAYCVYLVVQVGDNYYTF